MPSYTGILQVATRQIPSLLLCFLRRQSHSRKDLTFASRNETLSNHISLMLFVFTGYVVQEGCFFIQEAPLSVA
jgi:hypothetical protein